MPHASPSPESAGAEPGAPPPAPGPAPGLGLGPGLGVFALALAVRLAHFWFVRTGPLASDFVPDLAPYLFQAEKMLAGEFWLRLPMVMSPGYSLLILPVLRLFGPDVPLLVLQNALLDAGTAVLAAALAARVAGPGRGRAAGLSAGFLYALCGPLVLYALLPLGEGPAMFCLLAALLLLADAPQQPRRAWLAGALFGLAALMRPNLAPAGPLLALALPLPRTGPDSPHTRRQRALASARFLAALLLVLAPFMAHNLALEGRASPFGFQGGFTLYSGNHPGASGVGDRLPGFSNVPFAVVAEARDEASRRMGQPLPLAEADAFWYAETGRFLAEHPAEALRLLGVKALLLLNSQGVDATINLGFSRRFSPVAAALALPLGLLLGLAVFGLARAARCPVAAALAATLCATAVLVVLFQVTPRYRVVLLPPLIVFAGAGLAALPGALRGPRRALAARLLAASTLAALSLLPLGALAHKPGTEAQELLRLGRYYACTGRSGQALEALDEARALGADGAELRLLRATAELLEELRAKGQP